MTSSSSAAILAARRWRRYPDFSFQPQMLLEKMAEHSIDFRLQTEDLPLPGHRISYLGDKVVLSLSETSEGAAKGLKKMLERLMSVIGTYPILRERSPSLGKNLPINGTAHRAGTLRIVTDPKTSVLGLDCKAHELDDVYVTGASFMPSIDAVNPTLTIIADALRVADHIKTRLAA